MMRNIFMNCSGNYYCIFVILGVTCTRRRMARPWTIDCVHILTIVQCPLVTTNAKHLLVSIIYSRHAYRKMWVGRIVTPNGWAVTAIYRTHKIVAELKIKPDIKCEEWRSGSFETEIYTHEILIRLTRLSFYLHYLRLGILASFLLAKELVTKFLVTSLISCLL